MSTSTLEKEQVMFCIQGMPQRFTIDDLVERLVILARIESSEEQVKNGQVYSKDEIKNVVNQCLKR
jgi:hypothetical protein